MTSEQYTELIDFLGEKFGNIDQRFDRLEGRVTAGEVSLEALRDEVRLLAEGVTATNQRLDRFEASVNARFDTLDQRVDRLEARFDTLDARLDRLHMDHELRMTALEARCSDA